MARIYQGHAFPAPINHNALHSIRLAAKRRVTVTIVYKDLKHEVTTRETEPYEIKDGKYWGYDYLRNEIRQFRLEGILNAHINKRPYTPRWPVLISDDGGYDNVSGSTTTF